MTVEVLPELEIDVCADGTAVMSVYEDYAASIEETWPDFIKDFYG